MLACCTIESAVEELFHSYIWLREGMRDVDPRDLPRFISRLRLPLARETVRTIREMGYTVRGRRMAQLIGPGVAEVVATAEEIEAEPGEFAITGRMFGERLSCPPAGNADQNKPPATEAPEPTEDDGGDSVS